MALTMIPSLFSTLGVVGSLLIRAALLGFGYVLPALSSVKAVVHRDVDAYHLWVTYFLILHLYTYLEPVFDLALHPLLKLLLIMWLSLPRFQGALLVYDRLVLPFVERYEEDVDDKLELVGREVKRRAMEAAVGAGWGFLSQVGQIWGVLSTAQQRRRPPSLSDGDGEGAEPASERGSDEFVEEEKDGDGSPARDDTPRRRRRLRNPQHSVSASLSSIGSDNGGVKGDGGDRSAYARDFLAVLSRGLFVFARVPAVASDGGGGGGMGGASGDEGNANDNRQSSRGKFQLQVFSYEDDEGCFLISPVDSEFLEDGHALPIDDVADAAAAGAQGIAFLSRRPTSEEGGSDDGGGARLALLAEIVLSDAEDRETLLGGLGACLPELRRERRGSRGGCNGECDEEEDDDDDNSGGPLHLVGEDTGDRSSPLGSSCGADGTDPDCVSADLDSNMSAGGADMLAEFDAEANDGESQGVIMDGRGSPAALKVDGMDSDVNVLDDSVERAGDSDVGVQGRGKGKDMPMPESQADSSTPDVQ